MKFHETREVSVAIFQQAAIGIVLLNGDGSIRDVNPFLCKMLGYSREESVGRNFRDFGHADDHQATTAGFKSLIDGVPSRTAERRYVCKDGTVLIGRTTAARTVDLSGTITLIVTLEDITHERAAQQALARSQAYLKRLSESELIGIAVCDQQTGQIGEANDTFLHMHGYTRADLENKLLNWKNITAPEYFEVIVAANNRLNDSGSCPPFQKENVRKDGSRFPVLVVVVATDEPGKNVSWTLDVSRQRELEMRLLQTQKMEAVGQLAGGIAHDFNNLLMIISAHAELAAMGKVLPETQKSLSRIRTAAKQAEQLTRKLLTFGRKQELAETNFGIGQMVQEAIDLASPSIPKSVEMVFRRYDECWIRADYSQLQQVVVNLVLNARDAMPHGGRIVVGTSGVVVSDVEVGLHDTIPAGEYALLTVADTGEGIPSEDLDRIFDPFFTTKSKDMGSGLGLAMVYGAVTQSGGHIRVKSSPNTGTTFRVYLPMVSRSPVAETKGEQCLKQECSRVRTGTILVVDDEEAVRGSVRTLLEGCGLVVEEAADAAEALQKAEKLDESLAVVITDVVMPGMSGTELAFALRAKHMDVPVVFMSGYAAGEQGHRSFEGATFLQKPFSLAMLMNAVFRAGRCPIANVGKVCGEVRGAMIGKTLNGLTAISPQRL